MESSPPFTLDQMSQLLAKAVAHVGENYGGDYGSAMQPFDRMHRTKPSGHWDEIFGQQPPLTVLPKTEKDGGGHPQAPINHGNQQNQRIKGLHFSAKTCASGDLPARSPYGDERFAIDASLLLHPDLFNVYFADFYCSGGQYEKHRISLLVVKKDQLVEIEFCQGKMPQLDMFNNPFVRAEKLLVNDSYEFEELHFQLCARDDIWVEFFITDDVLLDHGDFDSVIPSSITGRAKPGGLPADECCVVCNLEPRRKTVKRKWAEAFNAIPAAVKRARKLVQNGIGAGPPKMRGKFRKRFRGIRNLLAPNNNHFNNNQQNNLHYQQNNNPGYQFCPAPAEVVYRPAAEVLVPPIENNNLLGYHQQFRPVEAYRPAEVYRPTEVYRPMEVLRPIQPYHNTNGPIIQQQQQYSQPIQIPQQSQPSHGAYGQMPFSAYSPHSSSYSSFHSSFSSSGYSSSSSAYSSPNSSSMMFPSPHQPPPSNYYASSPLTNVVQIPQRSQPQQPHGVYGQMPSAYSSYSSAYYSPSPNMVNVHHQPHFDPPNQWTSPQPPPQPQWTYGPPQNQWNSGQLPPPPAFPPHQPLPRPISAHYVPLIPNGQAYYVPPAQQASSGPAFCSLL